MVLTNFSKAKGVPNSVTTKTSSPSTTNFAKGINTYKPNDLMELDELHLAQDGRFDRIGEYKTRKGLSAFHAPLGKTQAFSNFSSTFDLASVTNTPHTSYAGSKFGRV